MRPAIARLDIQYSLRARKIWLALDRARGPGQTFVIPPGKEMSEGHPGLRHEQVGINRTQANGCRRIARSLRRDCRDKPVPSLPKGAPLPDWDRVRRPLRRELTRSPALRARRNTLVLRAQAPEDRPGRAASLVRPAVGFQPAPLPHPRSIRTLSSDRKCWLPEA